MNEDVKKLTRALQEAIKKEAPEMQVDLLDLYEVVEKVYGKQTNKTGYDYYRDPEGRLHKLMKNQVAYQELNYGETPNWMTTPSAFSDEPTSERVWNNLGKDK